MQGNIHVGIWSTDTITDEFSKKIQMIIILSLSCCFYNGASVYCNGRSWKYPLFLWYKSTALYTELNTS